MVTTRLRTGAGKRRNYRALAGMTSRRKKASTTLAPRARKAVATIAKRVFNRNTETKYLAYDQFETAKDIFGDTIPSSGPAQLFAVMPPVPEATTAANEYTRTGVKIQPTRLEVDVELFFNNNHPTVGGAIGGPLLDTASWDITVHMFYGYVRKYKQNADVIANSQLICSNLLDLGDGSTTRWDGSPTAHQLKLNKEYMSGMKRKVFRMSRPLGEQNTGSVAGGVTTYFPQKINKTVKLLFTPPKTLMFNETNDEPENYAPVLIIGYQHNDNTQASNAWIASGVVPGDVLRAPALSVYIKSHLWFKDA